MATTRIFIDSRVNDQNLLVSQFAPGTLYQLLDARLDGIEQIATALAGEGGYDSIQIISHGAPGSITLGSSVLDVGTLAAYAGQLTTIGQALTANGDLLLYGCNVAAGDVGQQFVNTLAALTGADVAASDDVTGSAALGGDWVLEVESGVIESVVQPIAGLDRVLGNTAPTFGVGDGAITTVIGTGDDGASSLVLQSDGKILVAGYTYNWITADSDFALVRYNRDGSLDATFGTNGKVITSVNTYDSANRVTLQSDGKILVVGSGSLLRYNSDGILDTTFSGDGIVSTYNSDLDVAVRALDGKIFVTGGAYFTVECYNSNGSLDTTFSGDGISTSNIPDYSYSSNTSAHANSIALQDNGKVVLAGDIYFDGSTNTIIWNYDIALVRYNSDGSLDTTFSGDGISAHHISGDYGDDYAKTVILQEDGKILVAGSKLWRYNSNGSLDTTFDTDGLVSINISCNDVLLQNDGKILVVGNSSAILKRYNSNGSLDTTFGSAGVVNTGIGGGSDYTYNIALQSDGKILVSGTAAIGSGNAFVVARYNSDGSLDTTFDSNILNNTPQYTENGAAVVLDSDVQIFDAELAALGKYAGASLTLARHDGANADDHFSGAGIVAGAASGAVRVSNTPIGNYTWSNGTLVINFNSYATQTLLNQALQLLAYQNISDAPPSSVQIDWTFSDGDSTGALNTIGKTVVTITPKNDAPTFIAFTHPVETTAPNQTVEISFADLLAQGNATDADGSVEAFVVKTVSAGTLFIGIDANSATAWDATTNALIDGVCNAYWMPPSNATGDVNAFTVVALDNDSVESTTAVQAQISVSAANHTPTGNVTISGTPQQGQTLTATNTLADVDGLGSITYQWKADGTVISGTTGNTLTLGEAQVGKAISVTASYNDGHGIAERVTSAATASVELSNHETEHHTLTGNVTFWKDLQPITDVTVAATASSATHEVEFKNVQLHSDGSRTVDVWLNNTATHVRSVHLEMDLQAGSTATQWESAEALSAWNFEANTTIDGQVIMGGMSTTALKAGLVKLGTLTLSAPSDASHFEIALSEGQLNNDAEIVPFSVVTDQAASDANGNYTFTDLQEGVYTLKASKSGNVLDAAVTEVDALAALMMAVGLSPNDKNSQALSYQYLAADMNRDGKVRAFDAFTILKMAVGLTDAPEVEWIFVSEEVGFETMNRKAVDWSHTESLVTLEQDMQCNFVGIVSGDVDGCWG